MSNFDAEDDETGLEIAEPSSQPSTIVHLQMRSMDVHVFQVTDAELDRLTAGVFGTGVLGIITGVLAGTLFGWSVRTGFGSEVTTAAIATFGTLTIILVIKVVREHRRWLQFVKRLRNNE